MTEQLNEQHIYHHSDSDGVRLNVKIEKNTKGFNYEATVSGAETVDQALTYLNALQAKLEEKYGKVTEEVAK
jgi:hypothetical protein